MARKLSGLIKRETERVIASTPMADDASELNAGHCQRLAEAVVQKFGGGAQMYVAWASGGRRHFFIKYNGRYYDAQRPHGVEKPSQLPFFNGETPRGMDRAKINSGLDGDIGRQLGDLF